MTATATRTAKKQLVFIDLQNSNSARALRIFWYISLASLHDYDVKMPNFTFSRENTRQRLSFSFPEIRYSPLELNSRNKLAAFDEMNDIKISPIKLDAA